MSGSSPAASLLAVIALLWGCDAPRSLSEYPADAMLNKTLAMDEDTVQVSLLPEGYLELSQMIILKKKSESAFEMRRANLERRESGYLQVKVVIKSGVSGPARKVRDVFPVFFKKSGDCVIRNSGSDEEFAAVNVNHINNFGYANHDQYILSFAKDHIEDNFEIHLSNLFNNGKKLSFEFEDVFARLADYSGRVKDEIESL